MIMSHEVNCCSQHSLNSNAAGSPRQLVLKVGCNGNASLICPPAPLDFKLSIPGGSSSSVQKTTLPPAPTCLILDVGTSIVAKTHQGRS